MNTILKYKADLNKHAELGWHEHKTTEYIRKTISLKPVVAGFGTSRTGLLYKLGVGDESITLRADIDALQTHDGVKHICGHSSHAAALMDCLISTIALESQLDAQNKSVYWLFQPAEETYPSGAKTAIDEFPELKKTRYVFAAHVRPLMPLGEMGVQSGPVWAGYDYFEFRCHGVQRHIKDSVMGEDALEAAAGVISAVKRIQRAHKANVRVNVGVMSGGRQPNTIADFAELKGDVRYKESGVRDFIKSKLDDAVKAVSHKTKTRIELLYTEGCPPTVNDPALVKSMTPFLKKTFKITSTGMFSYGCEDLSYFSSVIPTLMAFVGTGDRHDIHESSCTISDEGTRNVSRYFNEIVHKWIEG